jgi:K+-sensing histidine kinase KdpD
MQQQNFMMAVTHELKTPIAVTRLNLETLQKRRFEEAQQQKLIGTTLQEVNRLNSLCNNILLASQLDAGQYKSAKSPVNISDTCQRVIKDYVARYPNRHFLTEVEDDIILDGEELLLELLMTNLVENAVKYSPRTSAIEIRLSANSNEIQFIVKDEGPGVPAEEKEKIFDKFYRVGNEETRTAKGTGLGLYLCREIAAQHNAKILVADNNGNGSVFTVVFRK